MVDRSTTAGTALPVVLCCATGEADALAEVVLALGKRGHPVEVVDGVELDPRAIAPAIEQRGGNGFFVIVRAGALDRDKVDAVREVLLAHRLPFGRTLTVSGGKPTEMIERIEQSLRRQVAHAPGGREPAAPTGGSSRRTTLMMGPPAPASPRPAEPRATTPRASEARPSAAPRASEPRPAARSGETNVGPRPSDVRPSAATRAVPSGLPSPRVTTRPGAATPEPSAPVVSASRGTTKPMPGAGIVATPSESVASAGADTTGDAPPSSTPTLPGGGSREASPDTRDDVAGPEDQTRSFAASEDLVPGAAMVGEIHSVVSPMPEPDTSLTAMEIDADLVEDDPSIRPRPRVALGGPDDDIPTGVDLASVLDGIGVDAIDRTVTNLQSGGTVVGPAPLPLAPEAVELSLRDGVIIDYDKVDVTQVARAPAPPPLPAAPRSLPQTKTVVAPVIEEDGSRWRIVAAAVVAALGLGVLAAVWVSRGDDAETIARSDASGSTKPAEDASAKSGDTKADDANAGDAKVDDANAGDAKADDANAGDAKADDANAGDAKADDAKPDDASAGDTKASDAKAATKPTAPADASASPSGRSGSIVTVAMRKAAQAQPEPPPRTLVQKALRDRTIRALDVLLVTRRASAPMPQASAPGHCASLDLDGLGQWRLPEIGELASLTDAGIIGRGFYWSSTSADTFGDLRMAWNGAKHQGGVRYKNAAVICVRGERATGA